MRGGEAVRQDDRWLLGMKSEVHAVQWEQLEEEARELIAGVYQIVYAELLSRQILDLWDWGTRARHTFEKNRLETVGDLARLSEDRVSKLLWCGYQTRKEIYEVCYSYGVVLAHWMPKGYTERHMPCSRNEFQDRLKVNGS